MTAGVNQTFQDLVGDGATIEGVRVGKSKTVSSMDIVDKTLPIHEVAELFGHYVDIEIEQTENIQGEQVIIVVLGFTETHST